MNGTRVTNSGLRAALEQFERCLETPVVPGELPEWLHSARQASTDVGDQLKSEISHSHRDALRRMAQQDPTLQPRIEQMEAEDRLLLERWDDVHAAAERLDDTAEKAEPDEATFERRRERFVAKALAFVIEARTQEETLTTWYMEAFNRDRGTAD